MDYGIYVTNSPKRRWDFPSWGNRARILLLSWFGSGLVKRAPGTLGSIGAIPPAALIAWFWSPSALVAASALVFFLGWGLSRAHLEGSTDHSDPQWIVIDEVAGQWLTLAAVPLNPIWYLTGFLLFRVFDIYKPWPVRWADKQIPSALGIMLDDVLAGLYAALSLLALQFVWGQFG
jgi:phosphatidylglycerophosphatase A